MMLERNLNEAVKWEYIFDSHSLNILLDILLQTKFYNFFFLVFNLTGVCTAIVVIVVDS